LRRQGGGARALLTGAQMLAMICTTKDAGENRRFRGLTRSRRQGRRAGRQDPRVGGNRLDIKLVNIGFGNIVSANRIVAIVSPDSAPIKRIITEARDRGVLIDATYGRRTRAVIITDSDHVVLSAVQPETVANRLASREAAQPEEAAELEEAETGAGEEG
jgi:regulator of extracellular matrix RemA (YlzA/DUF370 family)